MAYYRHHGAMASHDLVIRGGTLIDGTGATRRVADVAIDDGIVTAVGGSEGSGASRGWGGGGWTLMLQPVAGCWREKLHLRDLGSEDGGECHVDLQPLEASPTMSLLTFY